MNRYPDLRSNEVNDWGVTDRLLLFLCACLCDNEEPALRQAVCDVLSLDGCEYPLAELAREFPGGGPMWEQPLHAWSYLRDLAQRYLMDARLAGRSALGR